MSISSDFLLTLTYEFADFWIFTNWLINNLNYITEENFLKKIQLKPMNQKKLIDQMQLAYLS